MVWQVLVGMWPLPLLLARRLACMFECWCPWCRPTFVAAQVDGQGSGPMLWALGLGWDVLKQGVFQCDGVVATKAIPFGSPFLAALIEMWGPMHVAIGQFPPGFLLGCPARVRQKKSVAAEWQNAGWWSRWSLCFPPVLRVAGRVWNEDSV